MILVFILLLSTNNFLTDVGIREMYKASTNNEETCKELFELLKEDNKLNSSPTKLAFYGGTLSLMAFYSDNPIEKIMYSNEANKVLDRSVELDPQNFDAISLRILYNANVPSILSNHDELNKDILLFYSLIKIPQNYTLYNEWMISIINKILSKSKL
jgi:hypothetical protein|tara:strand:+ start:486 stop:956 length:471 start_codon:yes stop_codon:yes gene_type:complete